MKQSTCLALRACLIFVAVGYPNAAFAGFVTAAVDNSTVQPGGPRSGPNGLIFFNMEGPSNGNFASFGVMDFQTPSGATVSPGPLMLSLILTQSNAAFSASGALQFYLTTDTTTNIDAGSSPLFYDVGHTPAGIGSQLNTTFLLGPGAFTLASNGTRDTFSFFPSGGALTYLTNQISLNGRIRLIAAPGDTSVAATYAGFANTNANTPGPELVVAFVPEPSPLFLAPAALGLLAAMAGARKSSRLRR